jgi:hypothetical protein
MKQKNKEYLVWYLVGISLIVLLFGSMVLGIIVKYDDYLGKSIPKDYSIICEETIYNVNSKELQCIYGSFVETYYYNDYEEMKKYEIHHRYEKLTFWEWFGYECGFSIDKHKETAEIEKSDYY